jgi:predicted nucleotide-binding protein
LRARILAMATVEEAIKGIDELREELRNLLAMPPSQEGLLSARLDRWSNRAHTRLSEWGLPDDANSLSGARYRTMGDDWHGNLYRKAQAKDLIMAALREDMAAHPDHYEPRLALVGKRPQSATPEPVAAGLLRVFLGHGRNKLWARVHIHLKDELRLDVEAWESEPRAGMHSVEILKNLLERCTFAVIVATGEDTTVQGEVRARQNVVHEIGLFQGHLGFEKVALLRQDGVEEFSNLAGLEVIQFPEERIEAAFYELDRMLKREGIIK